MDAIRLFSYKLKTDSGFAPNPFWGYMTLATCKPKIRKSKRVGDWLAGFTSKGLNGDAVGSERLIYLMKITEKTTFDVFFIDHRFQLKIPDNKNAKFVNKAGDNIYKPFGNDYIQIENCNHFEKNIKKDISSKNVLVSNNYYYFGSEPLSIPYEIRPTVPKGQSASGSKTHDLDIAAKFIAFIQNNYRIGVHSKPHKWPSTDTSWKSNENNI